MATGAHPSPCRTRHARRIVAVDIALRPHATRLRAGDVLRLDIRGTWHFPRNPLTGQFPAGYRRSPAGRCVIHAGGRFDSGLLLGMRESRDGPTWQV